MAIIGPEVVVQRRTNAGAGLRGGDGLPEERAGAAVAAFRPDRERAGIGPVGLRPCALDFGPGSVDGWLQRLVLAETSATASARSAAAAPPVFALLSAREREVLAVLAEGVTNQELADRLFINERTANRRLSNIFTKLGVRSRTATATGAGLAEPLCASQSPRALRSDSGVCEVDLKGRDGRGHPRAYPRRSRGDRGDATRVVGTITSVLQKTIANVGGDAWHL